MRLLVRLSPIRHASWPTNRPGDLDAQSAREVLEVLKGLNEQFKKTIMMVTHDPHAAAYASTRYTLEKGVFSKEEVRQTI